ncbi:hypothetical protein [uncultured Methanobrevibacter sp.]|uniref:hypothetical protein n=1 Tax=uncultured Methanobrevibacter sp. TaxID=253161 RepID=UPI0025DC4A66|nr:hypothetical protein [uncultured Methanobrevibacter sp.]
MRIEDLRIKNQTIQKQQEKNLKKNQKPKPTKKIRKKKLKKKNEKLKTTKKIRKKLKKNEK